MLTAAPKAPSHRLAKQSLGWKQFAANRIRCDAMEHKIYGRANTISNSVLSAARKSGYNAVLCFANGDPSEPRFEVRFFKFDFTVCEKGCFEVLDMECFMYVDQLQANFSCGPKDDDTHACSICQRYWFYKKMDEVACTSCGRHCHAQCAFPTLKNGYKKEELDAVAADLCVLAVRRPRRVILRERTVLTFLRRLVVGTCDFKRAC